MYVICMYVHMYVCNILQRGGEGWADWPCFTAQGSQGNRSWSSVLFGSMQISPLTADLIMLSLFALCVHVFV